MMIFALLKEDLSWVSSGSLELIKAMEMFSILQRIRYVLIFLRLLGFYFHRVQLKSKLYALDIRQRQMVD